MTLPTDTWPGRHRAERTGPAVVRSGWNRAGRIAGLLASTGACLTAALSAVVPPLPPDDSATSAPRDGSQPTQTAEASRPEARPPFPAQPREELEATVTLRDGRQYTGVLVEQSPQRVVLRIAGIETSVPAGMVVRVEILPPVLERYRAMRATIDDADVERLLMLVEWLRARRQWDLALAELEHVLTVAPEHAEARRLRTLVQAEQDLARKAASPPAGTPQTTAPPSPDQPPFPLLSPQDINLIRVYEVDLRDPPRMVIDRRTITRLMDQYAGDPLIPTTPQGREAMYALSPVRILEIMFQLRARDLYGEVRVLDHPRSMRLFRDQVHRTYVINYCASTRCHGGTEAGCLWLTNRRPGTDATVYTNFLILERYRLDDGRPLINYDEPARSPLLHLGLPRSQALDKHPRVPGRDSQGDLWRPYFRGTDDYRFRQVVEWIGTMYRPRPEYPVAYEPPRPPVPPPGDEREAPAPR